MITGLDHATIAAADIDATVGFFASALGLNAGPRPPFGIPGAWLYAAGQPVLHLVPRGKGVPDRGVIDHFSFAVDDLDAALARLDEAGVAWRRATIPGGFGEQAFFVEPNGATIELTCRGSKLRRSPSSLPPAAALPA